MRTVLWIIFGASSCLGVACTLAAQVSPDEPSPTRPEMDQSQWTIKQPDDAERVASKLLNVADAGALGAEVQLTEKSEDTTPFLSDRLVGRPLWRVTIKDWTLKLASAPDLEDLYKRVLDVWIDPESGQALRLETRWPVGHLKGAPEPDAVAAATQMLRGGAETYHGFPAEPPSMSFIDALDAMQRKGGNTTAAKQIIGTYVVWSKRGENPRPMWIITLRGLPPFRGHGDSYVPVEARNHMRYVVDPVTKRWLFRTTTPQPVSRRAEDDD